MNTVVPRCPWGIGSRIPVDTNVRGCLDPFYKMVYYSQLAIPMVLNPGILTGDCIYVTIVVKVVVKDVSQTAWTCLFWFVYLF